jgi:hypothetical protein
MAISITHDHAQRRIEAIGSGVITAADILSLISTSRIGLLRTYALLLDLRAATISVTPTEMQEFAARGDALQKTEGRSGPVAIVADRPGVSALARLYETLAQGRQLPSVRIFATETEAIEWLSTLG